MDVHFTFKIGEQEFCKKVTYLVAATQSWKEPRMSDLSLSCFSSLVPEGAAELARMRGAAVAILAIAHRIRNGDGAGRLDDGWAVAP